MVTEEKNRVADLDEKFMRRAISLALKGQGRVNPNPLVGAVIVKDGKIIGEGYHRKYGGLHAERNAINSCRENIEGSTMYVTLEPCCHYGKTPPCTEAIIEAKISRVVVGSSDPNPLVAGKGVEILKDSNIEVTTGVLEEECNRVNRVFFTYIREKRPYVTMKYAMTMDGKICTVSGKSKWITGEKSRARVHLDRHRYSAILVGVNTVAMDNPMLNTRLENIEKVVPESEFENYGITKVDGNFEVRNPVRVICDTNLRTPMDSNIVKTARKYRTVIATCSQDLSKIKKYRDAGCSVVVQEQYGRIDMKKLMNTLYEMGIDSVIVEGGAAVNWSSLEGKIIDSVQTYISPKIFGGITAKTPVSGEGVESPDGAYMLEIRNIEYLGEDILVESEVADCLREL